LDPRPVVAVSLLTSHLQDEQVWSACRMALLSLSWSDFRTRTQPKLYVWDNGTPAAVFWERKAWLQESFERVWIDQSPRNLGISTGRNRIMAEVLKEEVPFDFLLEIHTDHIFPKVWFGPLYAVLMENDWLGAICPALLTGGGQFGSPRFHVTYKENPAGLIDTLSQAVAVVKANIKPNVPTLRRGLSHPILKRASACWDVGCYYDEVNFPGQNFEDTDEVKRLEGKGWGVRVCLDSWVFHQYNLTRTRPRKSDEPLANETHETFYKRNLEAFRRKHGQEADSWLASWEADLNRVYKMPTEA